MPLIDPNAEPYILAHGEGHIRIIGPFPDRLARYDFLHQATRPAGEKWDPIMLAPDLARDCIVVAPEMVGAEGMAGRVETQEAVDAG
jgi:hypothetical protein